MAAKYCSLCGGENPPEALECQECGAPLPELPPEEPQFDAPAEETAAEVSLSPKKKPIRPLALGLAAALLVCGVVALLLWRFWPEKPAFEAKSAAQGVSLSSEQSLFVISSTLDYSYPATSDIVTRDALLKVDEENAYGSYTAQSADGARLIYSRWDGERVLYDRGRLERLECQAALLSGDGRYLFLLTDPRVASDYAEYGTKITRRDLETGASLVVAEGEEYHLVAAGYDGSRLYYAKYEDEKWSYGVWMGKDTCWVQVPYYRVTMGDSRGAVLMTSFWSAAQDAAAVIYWPDGAGGLTARNTRVSSLSYDKTLSTLLYWEKEDGWQVETAQGRRKIAGLDEEVASLTPLTPSRSETAPERVLDWIYAANDGGLYYLSAGCEATFLGQGAYYRATGMSQVTAVDPLGNTVYYLSGGEVFRIDRPRKGNFSVTQLTQGAQATYLYTDRALEHVYFKNATGTLCYLPPQGQPVEVCAKVEETAVQVMEDGGCWAGVSLGELLSLRYIPAGGGTAVDRELLVDRLIPLGERDLVAVRVKNGEAAAWRLEQGEAVELPKDTSLTLPPYDPPEYTLDGDEVDSTLYYGNETDADLPPDEDAADLPLDGEEDEGEWVDVEDGEVRMVQFVLDNGESFMVQINSESTEYGADTLDD